MTPVGINTERHLDENAQCDQLADKTEPTDTAASPHSSATESSPAQLSPPIPPSTPTQQQTEAGRKKVLNTKAIIGLIGALAPLIGLLTVFFKYTTRADFTVNPVILVILLVLSAIGVGIVVGVFWQCWRKQRTDLLATQEQLQTTRTLQTQLEQDLHQAQSTVAARDVEIGKRSRELKSLNDNAITMINPHEYLVILKDLVKKHGEGSLLLFNIELNSFLDNAIFNEFWMRLGEVPQLKHINLALPRDKFERWVNIVTGSRSEYFRREGNGDKFVACRYGPNHAFQQDRIAFALYDVKCKCGTHDWGAIFLLSPPFVTERTDGSLEYRHILEYKGKHEALRLCLDHWDKVFEPAWTESAARTIQLYERGAAGPPSLDNLLTEHRCDKVRADRIHRVVAVRRIVDDNCKVPPPSEITCSGGSGRRNRTFRLTYRREPNREGTVEEVTGRITGLLKDGTPGPCLIWASGFGDGQRPRLAELISRDLHSQLGDYIEVFFKKSGHVTETTCTRLSEDMAAVVDYVASVPAIDRSQICVIGISLSGYLAAKIAMRDQRIRSLVLVAPPFDVVEMLDNFRRHYLGDARVPTFDDFLKARANLLIANWDMNRKLCNYFGQTVTCDHLVDIAIRGTQHLDREMFINALETITHDHRQVRLIYGTDDPIVDSKKNIAQLKVAVNSNRIESRFFGHKAVPIAHYYPKLSEHATLFAERNNANQMKEYPIAITDARKAVHAISEAILQCLKEISDPPEIETSRNALDPMKLQQT